MESLAGQTVSHYVFLEKLGAGGMGEIYKARDTRLNRLVAIKVLASGTRDPEPRRRFIQEAQSASALNHPNIITINDILSEGDRQYLVMEHVAGRTLQQLIACGPLVFDQAVQIAAQIANALAAAHAAGIIHRDLKPANIMITDTGLVKILDFGLAKLLHPNARFGTGSDSGDTSDPVTLTAAPLTVEGSILGTVNYMSPEQAEGLRVDARSDIFSFGTVVYEMLTGKRAFDGHSTVATLSAVLRDEVKPITEIMPDAPTELVAIVARCMRKSPADRWPSMSEVAIALNALRVRLDSGAALESRIAARPSPASTPAPPSIRKQRTPLLIGAVVVAIATVGAWWQAHRQAPSVPVPQAALSSAPSSPPPTSSESPTTAPEAAAPSSAASPATIAKNAAPALAVPVLPPPNKSSAAALPTISAPAPIAPVTPAATPNPNGSHPTALPDLVSVTLQDATPFWIVLDEDVPLEAEEGQMLRFRVVDGVSANDVMVIAKGALVTGELAGLGGKRNFFGERSKAKFRLTTTQSVDDNPVKLRATSGSKSGGETLSFQTPKSTKDKNLLAAKGAKYLAYIAGDQTFHLHR